MEHPAPNNEIWSICVKSEPYGFFPKKLPEPPQPRQRTGIKPKFRLVAYLNLAQPVNIKHEYTNILLNVWVPVPWSSSHLELKVHTHTHLALMVHLAHILKFKNLLSLKTVWGCNSPAIILPSSLFSNSIPIKCKEHFVSSKIEIVRAFYRKSLRNWNINSSHIPQHSLVNTLSIRLQKKMFRSMNIKITITCSLKHDLVNFYRPVPPSPIHMSVFILRNLPYLY